MPFYIIFKGSVWGEVRWGEGEIDTGKQALSKQDKKEEEEERIK